MEGLPANFAHVRSLARVNALVHAQVGAVGERLAAEVAHVRSFTGVHPEVRLEAAALVERPTAKAADEDALRVDDHFVRVQVGGGSGGGGGGAEARVGFGAGKRSFDRRGEDVRQTRWVRAGFGEQAVRERALERGKVRRTLKPEKPGYRL